MSSPGVTPLDLPDAPPELADARVKAWHEAVTIPTYVPDEPSAYPAFLEARVYQGSSGKVYPLPMTERIAEEPVDVAWDAVHLENEWVRLMVLPELGGRIHVGRDKVRDYDFFYRNDVIKPALVGLAGPWVSGGVELNWPQHHRPATYLPVTTTIEHDEATGAVTLWCSDHDPLLRMKGMHGVRLHPDKAVVELVVRLHNRTELPQTFLWWANVAAEVHEEYQSFFPPDVHYVADHANRATVSFPAASGPYYGVDYPARVDAEHPDADRLDWYRNIRVPTSYMVLETAGEFFGGYDHRAGAGFVHWADRHVSPGKKQWTWGTEPFGRAWDRNLSDSGAPYVELMAGVYTNNQPDFTWLAPGETRTFSQVWYPIGGIGPAQAATLDAAARMEGSSEGVRVAVAVTSPQAGALVELARNGETVWSTTADLDPATPLLTTADVEAEGLTLTVRAADGSPLLRLAPAEAGEAEVPPPAHEPPPPADVASADELYVIGTHLEQYRHATRSPEDWWGEALRRDPGDARCNRAMGERRYRAGAYEEAETFLRAGLARERSRGPLGRALAPGKHHRALCLSRQARALRGGGQRRVAGDLRVRLPQEHGRGGHTGQRVGVRLGLGRVAVGELRHQHGGGAAEAAALAGRVEERLRASRLVRLGRPVAEGPAGRLADGRRETQPFQAGLGGVDAGGGRCLGELGEGGAECGAQLRPPGRVGWPGRRTRTGLGWEARAPRWEHDRTSPGGSGPG